MPTIGKTDQERLTLMAFTLILTAFGIPFFHSGNEFMRTKNMVHNSYNMPDSINQIDWELKIKNHRLFENVTQLIKLRNNLSCFHTYTQEEIVKNFTFETIGNSGLKYSINNNFIKDKYKGITVYLNNSSHDIHSKDILKKNQILICDSLYVNYDGVENHKYVIDDKVTIPKHGILIFGSINDK
jgi:pullulanase